MGKFDHVLLATDMDGTLLTSARQISAENLDAIRYFTDNGGRFTICTGRARSAAELCTKLLPINAPVVLLNGAVVYDYTKQKLLHMTGMPDTIFSIVKETADQFPELGIEIFLYDKIYICRTSAETRRHFEMLPVPVIQKSLDQIEPPQYWGKVNFTQSFDYLNEVRAYLKAYSDEYSMSSSAPYFYEVTNKDDNKGTAVCRVAQEIGVDYENLYTVGDNFNDLPMLRAAKLGFAPGNAEPEVCEAADVVVGSNDEHALRDVIAHLDSLYT